MMATTHALIGGAVAAVTLFVAPEAAPVAVAAGLVGGAFPDLDLYAGHRKTLHFPVYYSLLAALSVGAALLVSGIGAIAFACFAVGAALHSASDVLGGGLELRPWEGSSDRAVYDHYRGRWLAPRRWIRYDGAPEDLLVTLVAGTPLLALTDDPIRSVVVGAIALSAGYALLRKRLPTMAERMIARLPGRLVARVPDRFVEDLV